MAGDGSVDGGDGTLDAAAAGDGDTSAEDAGSSPAQDSGAGQDAGSSPSDDGGVPVSNFLVDEGFESYELGPQTEAEAETMFGGTNNSTLYGWDAGRAHIVDGMNAFSGKSLRIAYPEGDHDDTGVKLRRPLTEVGQYHAEYYYSFRVNIGEDFDPKLGGKLTGLCNGVCPAGGEREKTGHGYSLRFLYEEHQQRPSDGGCESDQSSDRVHLAMYLYHEDQVRRHGDVIHVADYGCEPDTRDGEPYQFYGPHGEHHMFGCSWADDCHLTRGVWHRLTFQIRLNTNGEANGILRVWIDGELAYENTAMRLVGADFDGTTSIDGYEPRDRLFFETFHGGSGSEYDPRRTGYILFDDVKLGTP
jgi:hypothetical protein